MREFSADERAALAGQYRAGASITTLAAGLGISASSLSNLLDTWGVLKRRGRSRAPATPDNNSRSTTPMIDRDHAVKLYTRQPLIHVATQLGVSSGYLRTRFKEWGIHIRNEKEASVLRAILQAEEHAARTPALIPRRITVHAVPADGHLLEIEGTTIRPFITTDDATNDLHRAATHAVREALNLPQNVPLRLTIHTPPDSTLDTHPDTE